MRVVATTPNVSIIYYKYTNNILNTLSALAIGVKEIG
jgi:hypothetical protein